MPAVQFFRRFRLRSGPRHLALDRKLIFRFRQWEFLGRDLNYLCLILGFRLLLSPSSLAGVGNCAGCRDRQGANHRGELPFAPRFRPSQKRRGRIRLTALALGHGETVRRRFDYFPNTRIFFLSNLWLRDTDNRASGSPFPLYGFQQNRVFCCLGRHLSWRKCLMEVVLEKEMTVLDAFSRLRRVSIVLHHLIAGPLHSRHTA